MRNFRSTLILFLVVLGALFWLLWDYDKTEKEKESKDVTDKIFQVEKDQISEIKVLMGDKPIELKKTLGQWIVASPVEDKADEMTVKNLLDSLTTEKSEEIVEEGDGIDLRVFGLDKPMGSFSIKTAQNVEKKVLIGSSKAFDGHRYLKKDGENKIHSVSSTWGANLEKPPKDFRDKKVFSGKSDLVEKLEILQASQAIVLTKKEGHWSAKDQKYKISDSEVKNYLDKISNLSVNDFVAEDKTKPDDLKKHQLTSIKKKINISYKEKDEKEAPLKEVLLELSEPKDSKYFLMSTERKAILEISDSAIKPLLVKLDFFRDKKEPFVFDKEKVTKISMKAGPLHFNFKKEATQWTIGDPTKEINITALNDFLSKIGGLEVHNFNPPKSKKSDELKDNFIELKDGEDKLIFELKWGGKFKDDSTDLYLTKTHLNNEIYGVKVSLLDSLASNNLVQEKKTEKKEEDFQKANKSSNAPQKK